MRKLLLVALTTAASSFIFADCSPDCCNSCNPCGETNCCSDPCADCYECPPATCNTCTCAPCCCEPCNFCPPEPPETCAYNAPKFYDLKCCWDMFVTGSFIYAQALEENLTYLENTTTVSATNASSTKFGTLCYDYNPAFKVGLGFIVGCDNWDFYAEYFRYHADTAKGSYSATLEDENSWDPCLYLSPFEAGIDALLATSISANTKWRLEIDMMDFSLRRKYFVGKCLLVQPSFGIRAGWIDQKQKTTYVCENETTNTTIKVTNTSDSWAVGAKAALDTEWTFCGSFRFFGNMGVAILYTDYDIIKSNATNTVVSLSGTTEGTFATSRALCFLRPDTNIALGFGWGDYFCCNDWYFDLTAAYEVHTYWNQNVLSQLNDCSQDPSSFYGDLYLHGLVITARLDF